jgi:hypothetical protein
MLIDAYNGFEAALWALLAIVVVIRYRHAVAGLRRLSYGTSALLVLFAGSDIIEMHTGAWWKPPGLLLFKGVCLVGLIWCFRRLMHAGR